MLLERTLKGFSLWGSCRPGGSYPAHAFRNPNKQLTYLLVSSPDECYQTNQSVSYEEFRQTDGLLFHTVHIVCASQTAPLIVSILNLKQLITFNLMSHWWCQCEAYLFSGQATVAVCSNMFKWWKAAFIERFYPNNQLHNFASRSHTHTLTHTETAASHHARCRPDRWEQVVLPKDTSTPEQEDRRSNCQSCD